MELTNALEGSKLLAGLNWEDGSLAGIAWRIRANIHTVGVGVHKAGCR